MISTLFKKNKNKKEKKKKKKRERERENVAIWKPKGNAKVQLTQYNDFILFFKMPLREIQKEKISIIYLG